jgi:L-fucose isomerase-like protein
MIRPKIGLLTVGGSPVVAMRGASAREYWGEDIRDRAVSRLEANGLEVVKIPEIVFSVGEMTKAAQVLRSADVDLIVVYFTSIGEEVLVPHMAAELSYPLLLWSNLTSTDEFPRIGIMGVIHAASNLRAMGRKFSYLLGNPDDPTTMKRILVIARAAAVVKKLRRDVVGTLTAVSGGQLDTAYDETQMRRVVADVDGIDIVELVNFFEEVKDEEAERVAKDVLQKVGSFEADRKDLLASVKTYLALKRIVNKYNLKAIAANSRPGLTNRGIYIHLAASLLSEEGIPAEIHEHDVPAAITELLLRYLTDLPSYTGEFNYIEDLAKNRSKLGHTGYTAFSLAETMGDIRLTRLSMHKSITGREGGVEVQFPVKPGRVTFAKLGGRAVNGRLSMFIARGEVVEPSEAMKKSGGGCFACIRPDAPVQSFLDAIITGGVEHHILLVHADIRPELEAFCDILDIDKITV